MKIKILSTREESGLFRVKVETDYGIDDIGLSLDKQKVNALTGKPKWLDEVILLIKQKYQGAKLPTGEEYVGQELNTEDF